ncbi:hypothetical protein [Fictibacillus nanhaiensis]|uniref:hypothetical protein n=1 Tax=Fictibacillus nanhaiensis TaxID=742169 RepID=UPI003AF330E4
MLEVRLPLQSTAFSHDPIIIYFQSTSFGFQSTSFGSQSTSFGFQSTSFGSQSTSFGYQSTSFGFKSKSYPRVDTPRQTRTPSVSKTNKKTRHFKSDGLSHTYNLS